MANALKTILFYSWEEVARFTQICNCDQWSCTANRSQQLSIWQNHLETLQIVFQLLCNELDGVQSQVCTKIPAPGFARPNATALCRWVALPHRNIGYHRMIIGWWDHPCIIPVSSLLWLLWLIRWEDDDSWAMLGKGCSAVGPGLQSLNCRVLIHLPWAGNGCHVAASLSE